MKTIKFIAVMMGLLWLTTNVQAEKMILKDNVVTEVFPDTSTWVLTRIGGVKAKQHTGSKVFITVSVTEKKVSGYTSCNFIKSTVSLKDTTIAFKDISFGKRECDAATAELEKTLLDAFQKVDSWKIDGDVLHLFDHGLLILEFKK